MKQKKGHRCDPAFVNLKSNTMKKHDAKVLLLFDNAILFIIL